MAHKVLSLAMTVLMSLQLGLSGPAQSSSIEHRPVAAPVLKASTQLRASSGWQRVGDRWRWRYPDGSYAKNKWVKTGGKWYVFDKEGYMITGWYKSNGKWYFLNKNGDMNTKPLWRGVNYYEFDKNPDKGHMILTELGITQQVQRKSNWCWAACASMVGNFPKDKGRTQEDIVRAIKGSLVNSPAAPNEIKSAINYASAYTKKAFVVNGLDENAVRSQIDIQRAAVLGVKWLDGVGGHVIVAHGYNLEDKTLYCTDPAKKELPIYRKISDLKKSEGFEYDGMVFYGYVRETVSH